MPNSNKGAMVALAIAMPASVWLLYLWFLHNNRGAADRKRLDQGNHECEVLSNSMYEAMESVRRWEGCRKNPGHCNFIPITEFSITDLPESYQIPEVFDLIKNVSARTVRIRVNYTSPARPEDYVFSDSRGKYIPHVGSGWIRDLEKRYGPCRCPECDGQATPFKQWWLVRVYTCSHVVFDTKEAQSTMVDVFYESEASRKNGEMMTMPGFKVTYRDEDHDSCKFYCITHDEELIKKLTVYTSKWEKIPKALMAMESLCVVVSHPHGRSKLVTVGELKDWKDEVFGVSQIYSTATCGGSSGAPVIIPRRRGDGSGWVPTMFPHSQALVNGLNMSAVGAARSY
ncbi:cytochrome p450, family 3, subfamily a, polypeptide 65 [Plakobranchus ocellatus]|uniref:Cytochrome p450, family 3, subfamily a, polypeptide 65 n=1 Tax=Plakobranchus ocellatus TaxID=259542 RepID=A0AAV3YH15_9GAST|nr:cytochrome p450, family 3, subfamily a, polypeptide 65 [Plakobranchus ocellatus]